MSNPIVFFGNERLATGVSTTAPTLQKLIAAGYTVTAVVANYEEGKSRSKRPLEIAAVAAAHGIPLYLPKRLVDITDILIETQAQVGVLVAYGKMVPQSIIDLFPRGIINIHPSLLPLHRGPTPLESVILDGSTVTGVSLMKLVKAMDAGPVYAHTTVPLPPDIDKQTLADQLLDTGGRMLVEHLPAILSGKLVPLPQDDSKATYDTLITREQGILDWSKHAIQLGREVRAFIGWPKSRTTFKDIEVIVTRAHSKPGMTGTPGKLAIINKQLAVYCSKDILVIDRLKPAGKQEMTGEGFLAGYRKTLGL